MLSFLSPSHQLVDCSTLPTPPSLVEYSFVSFQPSRPETPEVHQAAAAGDLPLLQALAKDDQTKLQHQDRNGWQPIHEAIRGGHANVVRYLLESGADINSRTRGGMGSSPLNVAMETHSEQHPVTKLLLASGAINIEPEL